MPDSEFLLELNGTSVAYPSRRWGEEPFLALDDFNLAIRDDRPSIIAIVGESGSGKTTLGRMILGMLPNSTGTMRYRGRELKSMSGQEKSDFRREVQAIFQDPFSVFNPFYKVDHLLLTPLRSLKIAKDNKTAFEMIETALKSVGMSPAQVIGRYPHQLSGGQRQRIVVARSLMLSPKIIVADEPVSMIDASLRANILGEIQALRDKYGVSIIYITHDIATARQVSDEVVVLRGGKTVESGSAESVISNPQHPYTRLLVSSVPRADPDWSWSDVIDDELVAAAQEQ